MDPIAPNRNTTTMEDDLNSTHGTSFSFVVNCSVDSLNSTPKFKPNAKSQTWTASSINKLTPPPLPPKNFIHNHSPPQTPVLEGNHSVNTSQKSSPSLTSSSGDISNSNVNSRSNSNSSLSSSGNVTPPPSSLNQKPLTDSPKDKRKATYLGSNYNVNDQNNNNNELKSTAAATTTATATATTTTTTNNNSNKDFSEGVTIGDDFVIINSEIRSNLVVYDNYGFLVDQEQIQQFIIYKDRFIRQEDYKKDNWINFFEKNPHSIAQLALTVPQYQSLSTPQTTATSILNQIQNVTMNIAATTGGGHHHNNSPKDSSSSASSSSSSSLAGSEKIYRQKTPKIFKELIRNGIHNDYRPVLWLRTSGAFTRLLESPDEYHSILDKYQGQESIATKQIAMDVERTFPEHKYYNTKEKLDALTRVLTAYSWRNPTVGYCQCMNFIAGFLLIHLSEHEVYHMMCSIVEDLLPTEYFTSTMIDSSVDVRFVFDDLLQKKLPKLHQHLQSCNLTLPLIITQWFLCIFATTTPTETTFRIWDVFFSEGSKVLFRVGLAFFKIHEEKLLTCRDYTTLYNLIKKLPSGMYDADHLMDVAFKHLGSFPMKHLNKKRKDCRVVVQSEFNEYQKLKASSSSSRRQKNEK